MTENLITTHRGEDSGMSRMLWTFSLAAPALLVAGVLAGLAMYSRGTVADESGLVQLEYNRLDRFAAPTTLKVRVAPEAARDREVKLMVSHSYINGVRIRRIVPTPTRVETTDDGVVFVFNGPAAGSPLGVIFQVEGTAYGPLDGRLVLGNTTRVPFKQYMLP